MALEPYFEPKEGGDGAFTVEAPKIKFGIGSLNEIGADAKALGLSRVALYTDPTVAKLQPVETALESLRKSFVKPARAITAGLGMDDGVGQFVGQDAGRDGVETRQAAERNADLSVIDAADPVRSLRHFAKVASGVEQDGDRLSRGVAQ